MKHNKKRNTGLLYEFLIRHAAELIVKNDVGASGKAIKLVKKHFVEGSELQKELRLFRALVSSYVESKDVAEKIVEYSRSASKNIDIEKLDREKSLLIRNINHVFGESIYDIRINEYKLYATIQTLLNEWRNDFSLDIVNTAMHEAMLVEHLLLPKKVNLLEVDSRADDITLKLMLKKVNTKHNAVLTVEQKQVLFAYIDLLKTGDKSNINSLLMNIRESALLAINTYLKNVDNDDDIKRLNEAKKLIESSVHDVIDDAVIAKFMRIASLKQEITQ